MEQKEYKVNTYDNHRMTMMTMMMMMMTSMMIRKTTRNGKQRRKEIRGMEGREPYQ
jgi:5-enolpyruvylshikimate-3-phosphate synthase